MYESHRPLMISTKSAYRRRSIPGMSISSARTGIWKFFAGLRNTIFKCYVRISQTTDDHSIRRRFRRHPIHVLKARYPRRDTKTDRRPDSFLD